MSSSKAPCLPSVVNKALGSVPASHTETAGEMAQPVHSLHMYLDLSLTSGIHTKRPGVIVYIYNPMLYMWRQVHW